MINLLCMTSSSGLIECDGEFGASCHTYINLAHISHLKVTEIFLTGVDTYGGNMGYFSCSCLKDLLNLITAYY